MVMKEFRRLRAMGRLSPQSPLCALGGALRNVWRMAGSYLEKRERRKSSANGEGEVWFFTEDATAAVAIARHDVR